MLSLLAQAFLMQRGLRPADTLVLTHPPYSLEEVAWSDVSGELAAGDDGPNNGYAAIDGRQTMNARLTTLANIVKGVAEAKHTTPTFRALTDACYSGVVGAAWSADSPERDNRGKVYLYFCPEDMTVALDNVQGIGWQGMPDSAVLFLLARRERVDAVRPFVFRDADVDKNMLAPEANRYAYARRLYMTHLALSYAVPKPAGALRRDPTVAEWLEATQAFAQREDIYPKGISLWADGLNPLKDGRHPPRGFKPTPWFPIPWNSQQLEMFDSLPTLGFLHRPVFVPTVDADNKPLSRKEARVAALSAGWQEALKTLPEAERKAAPARVVVASGKPGPTSTEQTIAISNVFTRWAESGGPELDTSRPDRWIDTEARMGNTGAATWFMQMAIGVMGSYKDGGVSAAINLRDPREASIVLISPPPDAKRKSQGEVFGFKPTPAIDPANYEQK